MCVYPLYNYELYTVPTTTIRLLLKTLLENISKRREERGCTPSTKERDSCHLGLIHHPIANIPRFFFFFFLFNVWIHPVISCERRGEERRPSTSQHQQQQIRDVEEEMRLVFFFFCFFFFFSSRSRYCVCLFTEAMDENVENRSLARSLAGLLVRECVRACYRMQKKGMKRKKKRATKAVE